jgi:hypothetical protein
LLAAMAGLCAQRSVCRAEAAKLYGPVFDQALSDEVDGVRQAAADGLINVDKAAALRRLRADFINDPNPAIRMRLIELAGEVGGREDLDWLSKRIGQDSESDPAWQAMLKVFRRSGTEVVWKWMMELDAPASQIKLSVEQKIALLTVIEQKAQAENNGDRLKDVWTRLFRLHVAGNDLARATKYVDLLLAAAADSREKCATLASLFEVCLASPAAQVDLAGALIEKYLSEKDLGHDSPIAKSINAYLSQPPEGSDPNALLAMLRQVKVAEPEERSLWRGLVTEWESFAKAKRPGEMDKVSN